MSLVVLDLTGSPLALGMVTAAQFGPFVVAGPIAGVLAERHGARRLLVGAAIGGAAITITLAAVAGAGRLTLPLLLVAAAAIGVVNSVERPVGQSSLRELVGPDLVPNAVAMLTVSQSVARLLGPAIADRQQGGRRLRVALRHVRTNPPLHRSWSSTRWWGSARTQRGRRGGWGTGHVLVRWRLTTLAPLRAGSSVSSSRCRRPRPRSWPSS